MNEFELWLESAPVEIDYLAHSLAQQRQQQLTKPAGSLGQLEDIALRLSGMQGTPSPKVEKIQITVFAADHGICAEGISAFPQAVTVEMVRNFSRGGAAISVLAKETQANLDVLNMGTVAEIEKLPGVYDHRIAAGTDNFLKQPAMTLEQCLQALAISREYVEQLKNDQIDLFIGGEMGIGNTTSATAIASALLNINPIELTGAGTGLNKTEIQHKAAIIQQALNHHHSELISPLTILQHVGGFEIAALAGAYITCAKVAIPVLIDGFISSVAALMAEHICPGTKNWFLYSHQSSELGHQIILKHLDAKPLLHIGMRLGEASGAAVTVPLIKLSCALHNSMATFAEAAVSDKA
jgi:nicotinate-nucleotide--dimethylbenzimidazole phosphoribosyltransferase